MTLAERLAQDSREAMRAREEGRLRLSVLRLALAAIRNEEIARRRPLSEEEVQGILRQQMRQRRDALHEIEGRGRPEAEERLRAELDAIATYLPPELDAQALEGEVKRAVEELGAMGLRDMGRVMAVLMSRLRGRADGAAVQAAVRRVLGA